jgi:two-component system, response regulator YesN
MKILIVDDEPRHCRGMAGMIRSTRSHAQVIIAKDGLKGLEVAQINRPDVRITDIRMPNMDGLTLLSHLSKGDYKPKVVMLSAYNLFYYAQQVIRHGAFDYLLKPVDIDKLEEVLARIEIELSKEAADRIEARYIQERLSMTVTSHRKQLVLDWLFGTLSTDGRRELEVTGVCHSDLSSVYT